MTVSSAADYLVELLVVIVIIATLAGLSAPVILKRLKAGHTETIGNISRSARCCSNSTPNTALGQRNGTRM